MGANGGAAGGGITTGNVAANGGTYNYYSNLDPGVVGFGGQGGVVAGAAPGNGFPSPTSVPVGGGGGGGGAASTTGAAQAGGFGGVYGGGGAGGGASANGNNSGAGGAGANGIVIVTTVF
jgi:hypothetical protein